MGMITITIQGSFGRPSQRQFSAMEGGHAMALTRAIEHLTNELPNAIRLDHKLQADGENPPKSAFGELPAPSQVEGR